MPQTEITMMALHVLVHFSFSVEHGWIHLVKVASLHMRTDAKNRVTTARTIHLPEHKKDHPHYFHVAKESLFRKYS